MVAITGDEEGAAEDGTTAILDWMAEQGERMDACLVGEPTSVARLGDVMKIGRRGSLNAVLTVTGRQGHSAYPERALNPLPVLARIAARLSAAELDRGTAHFQPSTLALTSIDTGNPASNVIPDSATARFNVRFNDTHTGASLTEWLQTAIAEEASAAGVATDLSVKVSGEAFLTSPGALTETVADAVTAATGIRPEMTTGGGTSDARFIRAHCPVVEFGLVGDRMHQVDERVPTEDISALTEVYGAILTRWFRSAV